MNDSRAPHRWVAASAVVVAALAVAGAAHAAKKATYEVDIVAAGAPVWQADALEAGLRQDLADDQLKPVPAAIEGTPTTVPELIIRGELAAGELRYAVERRGAAPTRGVVALGGLDRRALAGHMRDVLHELVRPAAEGVAPGGPAEMAAPGALGGALVALGVFAAFLLTPMVLAMIVLRRGRGLRATARCAGAAVAVGGVAAALMVEGDRVPELGGFVIFAGGLAWGAVAAALVPLVTPPIAGMHRVEHHELVSVLRAWAALALQRTLLLAVALVSMAAALWLLGEALALPALVTFGVIAPLVVLGVRLVMRGVVEVLAARLDRELVVGDASPEQPWHAQVRAYLVGYLRRNNVDVDEVALERMRFLPGSEVGSAIYGGGLTHTRVVIGQVMLEHALAPYGRPHDYLAPRISTLHWTHWNAGLVMPTEADARVATRADRQVHSTVDEGDHERIALGEPPTLTGIVEPAAFDPRERYRPDEDPLWLDWDPGEEHDGTDAGDKDYLFGLLVDAFGVAHRHEDRARTFGLAWQRWVVPTRAGALVERGLRPLRAFAARQSAALGDVATVLGGGRHHLAQYLGWSLWHRDDLLTARAYVPQLEQQSRQLARTVGGAASGGTGAAAVDAQLRRRLTRLLPYVAGGAGESAPRRRWVLAVAVATGVAAVAALVVQAVGYHGTYEGRMKAQQQLQERTIEDGERE